MKKSQKVVFIVGPTAVGKSQVAVHLAGEIDGEIIACDSMQVYREINIANDKPLPEAMNAIPHHMVDVVSVEEEFDVQRYTQLATKAIEDVLKKGHMPIVVGGSGLYMQVLLDGIFKGGGRNAPLRRELRRQAEKKGNEFVHQQLRLRDPEAASKIHPNDLKKTVRALEVCLTENQPISRLHRQRQGIWQRFPVRLFALDRDRNDLYERIDQRVENMFTDGLVQEVQGLERFSLSQTVQGLIGVKEVREYLGGICTLQEAKERIKRNTRHFAKRQLTWFRKEQRLEWIPVGPSDDPGVIARKIHEEITK